MKTDAGRALLLAILWATAAFGGVFGPLLLFIVAGFLATFATLSVMAD